MQNFAVIFDMDGLMLDTERMARSAWTRALADHGYMLSELAYLNLIGRTVRDVNGVLENLFGPELPYDSVFRSRQAYYDADIAANGVPVKPGLLDLLAFLEENNIPKAVASSTPDWFVSIKLGGAGIAGRFPVVVSGDQVPHGKPAPDLFLEAARRLGISPGQCIALEDSEAGIRSAFDAGMLPLMIPDLKLPSLEIESLAYRVLPSLVEARELIAGFMTEGLPVRS